MDNEAELLELLGCLKKSSIPNSEDFIIKFKTNRVSFETLETLIEECEKNKEYLLKISLLKFVLKLNDDAEVYSMLGNTYKKLNDFENAEIHYNIAISKDSSNFIFHYNKGVLYYELERYEDAKISFLESAISNKNYFLVFYNLGNTYTKLGDYSNAIEVYKRAIELNNNYAPSYYNLGVVYENAKLPDESLKCYDRAVSIDPENPSYHWNRALILLYLGMCEEGFKEYEWRLKKANYRYKFNGKRWTGEYVPGKKLFVYSEQGFGDIIYFSRFLQILKEKNAYVILGVKKELISLFEINNLADELVDIDGFTSDLQFDYYVSLLSIPSIVNISLHKNKISFPYIRIKSQNKVLPDFQSNLKLKIGIVWKGNPEPKENRVRHTQIKYFEKISNENIQLYSFQLGTEKDEIENCNISLIDLSSKITNFLDTALFINYMDVIVSVDTGFVHLAGAMNKKTFLLLADILDWRWSEKQGCSKQYPSVEIIRQSVRGDWESVFDELSLKLQQCFKHNFPDKNEQTLDAEEFDKYERTAINYFNKNEFVEAIRFFEKCEEFDRLNVRLINNLGLAYQKNNQIKIAEEKYKKAISLKKDYFNPYLNLIDLYLNEENFNLVERTISDAVDVFGLNNELIFCRGILNHKLGKYDEAEKYYLALRNSNYENLNLDINLGILYDKIGHHLKAANLFMEAIRKYPHQADLYFHLGNIYSNFNEYENALHWYKKAIELNPHYIDAYLNIGSLLFNDRKILEAKKLYEKMIVDGIVDHRVYYSLAIILYELKNYSEAMKYFETSLVIDPDCIDTHVGYSETLLIKGDFERGWKEYSWRLKKDKQYYQIISKIPKNLSEIEGKKVLIAGEQGIGDNIMFGRYLPLMLNIVSSFSFLLRKDLHKLFLYSLRDLNIKILDKAIFDNYDYIIPLLSLPELFGTNTENIPATNYINYDSELNNKITQYFETNRIKIGICWRGKLEPKYNRKRHISLKQLLIAFAEEEHNKFSLYNLQYEFNKEESELLVDNDISNIMSEIIDISKTALLIKNMDLVITVDTSIAHLSASMNKPTWLMLPYSPDWRWFTDINYSPWYNMVKIFRQKELESWDDVITQIKYELNKLER